jgi:hypothetical protein
MHHIHFLGHSVCWGHRLIQYNDYDHYKPKSNQAIHEVPMQFVTEKNAHFMFQHASICGPFWSIRPMRQVFQPDNYTYQSAGMKMGALSPSSVTQLPGNVGVWTIRAMSYPALELHPMSSRLVKVHNAFWEVSSFHG